MLPREFFLGRRGADRQTGDRFLVVALESGQELAALTHLSLLAGSATRESAPGLHRGQKVCPTGAMF